MPRILDFVDYTEYLKAVFRARKKSNPRFSYETWARRLKLRDASALWRYIHGKRALSKALLQKLSEDLKLDAHEKSYFELLILCRQSPYNVRDYLDTLRKDRSLRKRRAIITADQFELIAQWHHFAILEMTALSDFSGNPPWIVQRLGGKISISQCQEAIQRLLRLGLLTLTQEGQLKRSNDAALSFDPKTPSSPVRHYHSEVIKCASHAIETQPFQECDFRGVTMSIKKSQLPSLRKLIDELFHKLEAEAVDSGAEEIYQLSTQLFKLTSSSQETSQ